MSKVCCICGKPYYNYGNNPDGAAWLNKDDEIIVRDFAEGDKCCNKCDRDFVTPGRIFRYYAKYSVSGKKYLNHLDSETK